MTRARGVLVPLLLPLLAATSQAQEREVQHHDPGDPEGRLLVYYAAALAFSGIGPGRTASGWEGWIGGEVSYIPPLSRAERAPGTDKPEASNLAPVLPRIRFALSTPGGVHVEGGWVPPLRVFDARAHLLAVAVSRQFATGSGILLTPRLSASGGRVSGAITCYDDLPDLGPDHALYYATICHGRESDDHYDPRQFSGELVVARRQGRFLTPYLGAGVRYDDIRFDVGVQRADGTRETDQPILLLEATRFFATAGVEWDAGRGQRIGAEIYYAPGSLITVRGRLDVLGWRPR